MKRHRPTPSLHTGSIKTKNHPPRLRLWTILNTLIQWGFVLSIVGWYFFSVQDIPRPLTVYLAAVNAGTFFVYGYDKSLARRHKFRVSEWTLHAGSLAGGTPGAIAGQLFFRHKINKLSFQIILEMIIFAQAAALYWIFIRSS